MDNIPKNIKAIYFIHIPKTSGQNLNFTKDSKIKGIKYKHGFNVSFAKRLTKDERGYFLCEDHYWPQLTYPIQPNIKITIIRNPYDLLCSYYFHKDQFIDDGNFYNSGWANVNYTHKFTSFEQFIQSYCDPDFKWHEEFLHQFLYSQLFDEHGNCVSDIILKYEFINEGIAQINNHFNIQLIDLYDTSPLGKKKNKSIRKEHTYQHYYTPEMIALVKKKCRRELNVFGYDFEGPTNSEIIYFPNNKIFNLRYNIKKDKLAIVYKT